MKPTTMLNRTSGFTIVETVLAVLMISLVGIMGSRVLLDSTRASSYVGSQQKVSTLAEMVFQQYASYVAENFNTLPMYNSTNVTPATFFGKPNNFGFDGYLITTTSAYAANHSTATVTVSISWYAASSALGATPMKFSGTSSTTANQRSTVFMKTYSAGAQTGGGALQVIVKLPCDGLTDPSAIASQCPGIQGFQVSAPSASGMTASGTTDSTGQVTLSGVAIGAAIAVQVAGPTPSDYSIPPTSAQFVQGYYAVNASGAYVATLSTQTSVTSVSLSTLVLTSFQPAGTLSGHVSNISTVVSNPPVANMTVALTTGTVWQNALNSYEPCVTPCEVVSDANGYYSFNNVLPGTMNVNVYGVQGSSPTVAPGQAGFAWAYTGVQGYSNLVLAPSASSMPPSLTQDVTVNTDGWLKITARSIVPPYLPVAGLPLTTFTNLVNIGNNFQSIPAIVNATTDSNGQITLYNVFTLAGCTLRFEDLSAPTPGNHGYLVEDTVTNSDIGREIDQTAHVQPGYLLTSRLNDLSGHPSGITFSQGLLTPMFSAVTDSLGNFSLNGFFPNGRWGYGGGSPVDPSLPFNPPGGIVLTNGSLLYQKAISGQAIDVWNGGPAAHATVYIWGGTQPTNYLNSGGSGSAPANELVFTTDVNGHFPSLTAKIPYNNLLYSLYAVCDNVGLTCVLCDSAAACLAAPGVATIDTSDTIPDFSPTNLTENGYVYDQDYMPPSNWSTQGVTLNRFLVNQLVDLTVVDATNHPVQGVCNVTNLNVGATCTDNHGHMPVTGWSTVSGRAMSNPGTIDLVVPAQLGFPTAEKIVTIAQNPDPATPMPVTIQLAGTRSGGL